MSSCSRLSMEKGSSFPIYGAVTALMRKKGDQPWSGFGCFRYRCLRYEKSDIRRFCELYISSISCIANSCEFEFAIKAGCHIFLLVELDGKFGLPVELVD